MSFEYSQFWADLIEDLADPEFREAFIDNTILFMEEYHESMLDKELELEEFGSTHDTWSDCTGRQFFVHKRNVGCDIDGCAIHNPSYHPLSDARQYMRVDKGYLIERICDHGVGHPDPDSASFMAKTGWGKGIWIHGCDGCCREPEKPAKVKRGWGPHVHHYEWGDDGIGHSGSFCRCGQEEPEPEWNYRDYQRQIAEEDNYS